MPDSKQETKPAVNEFHRFAQKYFSGCKARFDALDALVAKWYFEDLIPGLSDFDSRIIVTDDVGPEEMIRLDRLIGEVHLELCREFPKWARILEHPPGICVTWSELYDPMLYQPETRTWSFYLGSRRKFREFEEYLSRIPWKPIDEYYHLNRFAYYFSPYQRGIDPAINLGIFEPEYAWHSRAMHYFVPAIQSGLSVIKGRAVRGKLESLRIWKDILPKETIFEEIMGMTSIQYALPNIDDENALAQFEKRLFEVLCKIKQLVFESVRFFPINPTDGIESLRSELKKFHPDPLVFIFNGVRFCRIRKGRYLFYLNAPEYFSTDWLIENEFIKWNRKVLIKAILGAYGELKCGKSDAGLDEIIEAICPELIGKREAEIMRKIYKISFVGYQKGMERKLLKEIIPLWADYYLILEKILQDAKMVSKDYVYTNQKAEGT